MDSLTFEDLQKSFHTKLCDATSLTKLRDFTEDDDCVHGIEVVEKEIRQLVTAVRFLRVELDQAQQKTDRLKELSKEMASFRDRLQYTVVSLPERFRKQVQAQKIEAAEKSASVLSTQVPVNQLPPSQSQGSIEKQVPPSGSISSTGKNQENIYFPEIDYLTTDEFEAIPKYMKGRLTYDKINKFVDEMNTSYKAKYKVMKQSLRKMNDANRKRYETYKSQVTKDTKGCYFIVDEDIRDYCGRRVDKEGTSIIAILRHFRRIKEVRGGRLTRYVYVDSY